MGTLALVLAAVMAVLCATSYTLPPPSINLANRSALFGLLYAMGFSDTCVSEALDTCAATPQENQSTLSVPHADRSTLFILLHDVGFSDTCVASALDVCAGVSHEGQIETILKDTRDLLQETRDLQVEQRDFQQQTRDLQQETRDLQQEERVLHQKTGELLQETRDLLQHVAHTVNKTQNQPRHCKDLLDAGDGLSGVRVIYPYPGQPERRLRVYCDQTTDFGGWTVFQRRKNSTVREDFYRSWAAYKDGFGNLEEEFWLGLDALHALTSTEPQELRIDLADWEGGHRYAKYESFSVDDHEAKYRLTVGGYSGTAGDSFASRHSGQKFSTHDSDNDSHRGDNCAVERRGAWWYDDCTGSNLNGYQYEKNPSESTKGIYWYHWRGNEYTLRRTTMMLRPGQQN